MNTLSKIIFIRRKALYYYIILVKKILFIFLKYFFGALLFRKRWKDELYYNFIDNYELISFKKENITYKFYALSLMSKKRYQTMFIKEPETIKWIDSFEEGSIFWDIGANVGIYSIYYAKKNLSNLVYSFEPSVFNLELLARNIVLNQVNENVSLFPMPLNFEEKLDNFNMNNTEYGGALSGFGVDYDDNFKKREINFKYRTFSLSIDSLLDIYCIDIPNYIKIDVDGIENLILKGSVKVLKNPNLKSILIENPTNSDAVNKIMINNNFYLDEFKKSNQIWIRK